MKNKRFPILLALLLMFLPFMPVSGVEAEIYIDIVSAPRRIPIAIQELAGPQGKEISDIVSYDLEFSGLFSPIDRKAFLELPEQAFKRANWKGIGAEAVVKGYVTVTDGNVNATVYLYDAFEGESIMKKNYSTKKGLLRPLAHSIATDVYRKITGQEAVFRTKIAFVRKDKAQQELHLSDWDGKRAYGLNIKSPIIISPRWSRDGKRIIYSAVKKGAWGIYMLDLDRKKDERLLSGTGTHIAGDFFSSNNEFALSSSRAGTPDIYIFDIPKSKLTRLTKERGIEVSPAVSPDGRTVAFVSDMGGSAQIYSMDKIGYNRNRITYEGRYNTSPTWSPRGDMLAFSGSHEGKNQIFVVRPDGTGLKRLTEDGNNEQPVYSPDGRFIAFTSDRQGKKGIYVMRANGEGQRIITSRDIVASDPRWSPY
jgi:TolB protein